jgi:energy-coupling factor transporter ATP-binding protein EcfA2
VGAREVFETLDALTGEGATVIMAEHKLEWIAAHADRVIVLQDGRIVADGAPRAALGHASAEQFGLMPTRYTLAARLAMAQRPASASGPLPVTLDEAQAFFTHDLPGFDNLSALESERP